MTFLSRLLAVLLIALLTAPVAAGLAIWNADHLCIGGCNLEALVYGGFLLWGLFTLAGAGWFLWAQARAKRRAGPSR